MNYMRILLLIISILRSLNKAETKEELATSTAMQQLGLADGRFLEWLWENREELFEFLSKIFGLFQGRGAQVPTEMVFTSDEEVDLLNELVSK